MSIRYFSEWTKRTAYQLREHKEKGLYVVEAHSSELTAYDPFSCSDDILFEILSIGRDYATVSEYRVLDFCNRFGLLGFGQTVIEKEYENSTAKLYPDNVLGKKVISDRELMDLIFPFDKYSHRVKIGNEMSITTRWEIGCETAGRDWPLFSWLYSERVDWIVSYARRIYELFVCFYKQQPFEYPLCNVKCKIVYGDEVNTQWQFDSLKSAIDIIFMRLLQQSSPTIRLCRRCMKPFSASPGTRAAYCSTSCRNVENVKNSRQRKKPEAEQNIPFRPHLD